MKSLRRFTCPGEKLFLLELRHHIIYQEIQKILPTRNIKRRIVRGRSLVSRHLGTLCLLMDWYLVIFYLSRMWRFPWCFRAPLDVFPPSSDFLVEILVFERKWEILTAFFFEVLCLSSSFLKRKQEACIRKRVGYLEVSQNAWKTRRTFTHKLGSLW